MTLYEIEDAISRCQREVIDEETGEVTTEVDTEMLEALRMAKDEKVENILCWIKNLSAESSAIEKESKNLERRAKALSNKADSLKRYVAGFLHGEKWSGVRAAVTFRKTESVEVDDLTIIPKEYLRIKTTAEPDKKSIKDAITKLGETIPGAHIAQNISTIVR